MRAALSQGSELGLATLPREPGPVPAGVALAGREVALAEGQIHSEY